MLQRSRVVSQTDSWWTLISLARFRCRESHCRVVCVQRALEQICLPVHQFSPVCIIPPLFHIHSFIYHWRCIMLFSQYISLPLSVSFPIAPYSSIYHPRSIKFFSQYFSFPPLSVSFPHCSIFIHLPPTLYNAFLPILQFSPVSIIRPLLHIHSSATHAV